MTFASVVQMFFNAILWNEKYEAREENILRKGNLKSQEKHFKVFCFQNTGLVSLLVYVTVVDLYLLAHSLTEINHCVSFCHLFQKN